MQLRYRRITDVVFGGAWLVKAGLCLVLRGESEVSLVSSLWISVGLLELWAAFVVFLVFGCGGGLFRVLILLSFVESWGIFEKR